LRFGTIAFAMNPDARMDAIADVGCR
jgi:hypothetical protein